MPQYIVENEATAFEKFQTTGIVTKDPHSAWAKLVKSHVDTGKTMQRLRLISDELTSYEQYELQAYPGIEFGEDIRINARSAYVADKPYDFWYFDATYIAIMNYQEDGTFIDYTIHKASEDEKKMVKHWQEVFEASIPLK